VPQPRFQVGESCLALPRAGGHPVIVYRVHSEHGWPEYSFRRTYTEEATTFLPGSWYEAKTGGYGSTATERVQAGDPARYRRLRAAHPDARWTWQVSRRDFATILRDLAIQLGRLHERNEVHGDLKPANVLLTATATEPLDSLRLAPGERAPAMTRGWAAPEQILGLAVSPQSDQYALGLLLLRLVGGVLYGEEARVSIPTGGTQLEYHTVLRNPAVYIDPATAPIERAHVAAWRDLIERCVRFEAADRFPAMADVAEALRPLIDAESLNGTVETPSRSAASSPVATARATRSLAGSSAETHA
jgi:serine/threonine protein kinase